MGARVDRAEWTTLVKVVLASIGANKGDGGANTPISGERAALFLRDPRFWKTLTPGPVALAAVARQTANVRSASHRWRARFDASTNALLHLSTPHPISPVLYVDLRLLRSLAPSKPTQCHGAASSVLAGTDSFPGRHPTAPCGPHSRRRGASAKCLRGYLGRYQPPKILGLWRVESLLITKPA